MNPSYAQIRARVDAAAQAAGHAVRLLAVSKTKPAAAIRELAAQGQRAFGENYVQETIAKQGTTGIRPLPSKVNCPTSTWNGI